jgi:hypothetical protein
MNVLEMLVGRKMLVMTDMNVEIELEIKSVKESIRTIQITPDTKENDYWGETSQELSYYVIFTNDSTKTFKSLNQINII